MPSFSHAFSSECEMVLYDFKDIRYSIVATEENVNHRAVGSPLTSLILQIIRKDEKPADFLNYNSFTRYGRDLISSTIFIRNEAVKAIGCLRINRDIHRWKTTRDVLEDCLEAHPLGKGNASEDREIFFIRGAVQTLARTHNISHHTIY